MRTVDPVEWYRKLEKPSIHLRFGRKSSSSVEMRLRNSFYDAVREYWKNCSVPGVKHFANGRLSKLERYQQCAVLLLALCVGAYVAGNEAGGGGTQVSPQPTRRRIHQVPFPAVALCSSGIFSRRRINNITSLLTLVDRNHTYHWTSIRRNLLTFGSMLTMSLPQIDVDFMRFLTVIIGSSHLNVSDLMYHLWTPCDDTLKRCSWRGKVVPCDRMFATRVTPLGFCCVFNSRYYAIDLHRPPKYSDMTGQDFGLSVVIQENPEDFACIRRASIGLDVLLFDGSEYPLLEGGGVRMIPVERDASVVVAVRARAQRARGGGAARACRRRLQGGPRARRGYVWCLAQCRSRTMAALCGCRHYTLPADVDDAYPLCSLSHLSCLNKHKEKFLYYYPTGAWDPALDEELQNGQECSECAPDCTRLLYSAAASVARHQHTHAHHIFRNRFMKDQSYVNSTVIRLFFSSEHQELYIIEDNEIWFETFATIGSQWTGVMGLSAAAGSELVFHLTVRWARHYRRRRATRSRAACTPASRATC